MTPFTAARALAAAFALWSAAAAPAWAYIDPTAAGAFLQSMYVILASAVLFVAAMPHKIAAAFQSLKARLRPGQAETAAPEQDR